jgi:hypothetical protein
MGRPVRFNTPIAAISGIHNSLGQRRAAHDCQLTPQIFYLLFTALAFEIAVSLNEGKS